MHSPSDSLHDRGRSGAAPTDHRDIVRNPSRFLGLGPCPTATGEYAMLSPRGGRPHDATTTAPSSSSPRQAGMDAGDSESGRVLEWEIGLPAASELTPVSHPLITPFLAAAFRIDIAGGATSAFDGSPYAHDSPTSHLSFLPDEDDGEEAEVEEEEEEEGGEETADSASGSCACRGESAGRAVKKARIVWTPELHHRFVEAVAHLGDKGAVPKSIVRLMNVDGLTRENVASHLQKYRLYLKRTRNPSTARPLPPFPAAYGPAFNYHPPSDTPSRSGYYAFPPATARASNATKHSRLWDGNGPKMHKTESAKRAHGNENTMLFSLPVNLLGIVHTSQWRD